MIYGVEDIERDVRVAMDENSISDNLIANGDLDTLSLNDIVRSKITEGVRRTHMEAPVYLLDSGHNFGDMLFWGEKESGWILLPDDFMRLLVFQMDDWAHAVFEAISPGDAEYKLQSSRYKGIRGNWQKPICAISIRPEGKVLEFWSCKSEGAKVSKGVYLPYPKIDMADGIEICNRCYEAAVYVIAGLVCESLGDAERYSMYNELAKSILV